MTEDADDREKAEAQALADALAGRDGATDAPDDALETAALLRYTAHDGELPNDRAEALLSALLPHVHERPARSVKRLRLLAWAGGALAAAAVLLLVVTRAFDNSAAPGGSKPAPEVAAAARLPRPPASLLAAQADLARDKAARNPAAFDAEMRRYREQVLRALEREYPARVGSLELRGRR